MEEAVIRNTINSWLQDAEDELIKNYKAKGLKSSGNFERSIVNQVDISDTTIKVKMLGPDYVHQMVHGRKAGKFPPITAIKNWIENKGIGNGDININSLAYIIARSIARNGIKVPNFYNDGNLITDTFTDARIKDLYTEIGKNLLQQTKHEIINNLKQ